MLPASARVESDGRVLRRRPFDDRIVGGFVTMEE
jgi:hypothetical protein